jgi:hypothetical protein
MEECCALATDSISECNDRLCNGLLNERVIQIGVKNMIDATDTDTDAQGKLV